MYGTYSNPSSVKYFVESGVKAVVAANTLGAAVLYKPSKFIYIRWDI